VTHKHLRQLQVAVSALELRAGGMSQSCMGRSAVRRKRERAGNGVAALSLRDTAGSCLREGGGRRSEPPAGRFPPFAWSRITPRLQARERLAVVDDGARLPVGTRVTQEASYLASDRGSLPVPVTSASSQTLRPPPVTSSRSHRPPFSARSHRPSAPRLPVLIPNRIRAP
jgi:hypothetical protein